MLEMDQNQNENHKGLNISTHIGAFILAMVAAVVVVAFYIHIQNNRDYVPTADLNPQSVRNCQACKPAPPAQPAYK